jgi:hypothetical protein
MLAIALVLMPAHTRIDQEARLFGQRNNPNQQLAAGQQSFPTWEKKRPTTDGGGRGGAGAAMAAFVVVSGGGGRTEAEEVELHRRSGRHGWAAENERNS